MNRQFPRVLIVEDEPTIAHMLAKIFEMWHWDAIRAATVAQAMASLDVPYDLVLVDLMLPDGDGVDVVRAARENPLVARVVVTSAKVDTRDVRELVGNDLLVKPFLWEPLRAMADQIYRDFKPRKLVLADQPVARP